MLRGWMVDPQVREPVGLSGGRLAEAVGKLVGSEGGSKLSEELQATVEWFAGFGVAKITEGNDPATVAHGLAFLDRFFRTTDKYPGTERNHHYFLSANDVNEGVLYELFLGVLCLHPDAPSLFAIDNGDHGLNPLLARHLIQAMCGGFGQQAPQAGANEYAQSACVGWTAVAG